MPSLSRHLLSRLESVYRLIVSITTHWRSYLMAFDVNLFTSFMDMEMVTLMSLSF